jgi:uncharacterized protein (UPF0332 family)
MSFDWREYLDLAEALMGSDSKSITIEAAFRCSMSRIYYAAFCHARNYAQKKQRFVAKCNASDHARIREHFRSSGMTRIAGNLDRLRQWRNACDYEDSIEISARSYDAMLAQAKYVFDKLRD